MTQTKLFLDLYLVKFFKNFSKTVLSVYIYRKSIDIFAGINILNLRSVYN